jgi:type IV secretory pathway VirB3-like protein
MWYVTIIGTWFFECAALLLCCSFIIKFCNHIIVVLSVFLHIPWELAPMALVSHEAYVHVEAVSSATSLTLLCVSNKPMCARPAYWKAPTLAPTQITRHSGIRAWWWWWWWASNKVDVEEVSIIINQYVQPQQEVEKSNMPTWWILGTFFNMLF